MERIGKFKTYTLEECLEKYIGPIGTAKRDEFENKVKESVRAYHIKKARMEQTLLKMR
ncbi:MAG: hypothetical protein LUC37_00810 [Prevotella sp.]|nr:hypothetical protein [Prevotella sp.]